MKLILTAIFIWITVYSFGQESRERKELYDSFLRKYDLPKDTSMEKECNSGIDSAIADIKRGKLKYFFYGYMTPYYYSEISYLSDKYGFESAMPGCQATPEMLCYNLYLDKILEAKFDKGFWNRAHHEIDSLREIGLLSREAYYKGGDKKFEKDFIREYKKLFPENRLRKIDFMVRYKIDSIGNIIVLKDLEASSSKHYPEVKKVLSKMKWQPEIISRKKVNSQELTLVKSIHL